jgi:hypothetical protein
MAKAIRLINRIIMILPFLFLASCGEEHALKEETLSFAAENKDWLVSDTVGDHFIMIDNNGISQSFAMNTNQHEFSKSWGSFLGINTHMTYTEYQYQSFSSSYGIGYSLSLTAGFEPFGDDVFIKLGEIGFDYDLKIGTVARIDSPYGYLSKIKTDEGFGDEEEKINSTAEILDSVVFNGIKYANVLYFTFNDYPEYWDKLTVKEIYVAQKSGLIRYILNGGVTYDRK